MLFLIFLIFKGKGGHISGVSPNVDRRGSDLFAAAKVGGGGMGVKGGLNCDAR